MRAHLQPTTRRANLIQHVSLTEQEDDNDKFKRSRIPGELLGNKGLGSLLQRPAAELHSGTGPRM